MRAENKSHRSDRLTFGSPEGVRSALPLQDLGFIGGRRVHIVPAWWSVSKPRDAAQSLRALVGGVEAARPEADTMYVGFAHAYPFPLPEAPASLRVVQACPARWSENSDAVAAVDQKGYAEALEVLALLGLGDAGPDGALALAAFWRAREPGADVVVVLGAIGHAAIRRAA